MRMRVLSLRLGKWAERVVRLKGGIYRQSTRVQMSFLTNYGGLNDWGPGIQDPFAVQGRDYMYTGAVLRPTVSASSYLAVLARVDLSDISGGPLNRGTILDKRQPITAIRLTETHVPFASFY